ncbi:late competence development ComFB family protein [Metabacillus fastidiosus]|uniref:late competence development ComFB family protein n=1 Tax=Metabacillus fastidiosus TaxID=1458 RepID=UPI003D2E1BF2
MVINAMEKIMRDLFSEYEHKLQMKCTCESCKEDVLAMVLNKVPPKYVTNEEKVMYIKASYVDKQEMTTLLVKLIECAKLVSDNPYCKTGEKAEVDQSSTV